MGFFTNSERGAVRNSWQNTKDRKTLEDRIVEGLTRDGEVSVDELLDDYEKGTLYATVSLINKRAYLDQHVILRGDVIRYGSKSEPYGRTRNGGRRESGKLNRAMKLLEEKNSFKISKEFPGTLGRSLVKSLNRRKKENGYMVTFRKGYIVKIDLEPEDIPGNKSVVPEEAEKLTKEEMNILKSLLEKLK